MNTLPKNYIYYCTCFEIELLKKQTFLLSKNNIDFKVIQQSRAPQFRAPLSTYFEAEIHVLETDFERTADLLSKIQTD